MHQQRCGGNLVSTVFIGQCSRLFNWGEMFGGGWCVNVSHLYAWRWRGLNIALS